MKWSDVPSMLLVWALITLIGVGCAEVQKPILENASAYNSRGVTYYQKGQFDQAIKDFTKAIEIQPRYAEAYCYRGIAYHEKGQFDRAISDCNKAIEINPKLALAYNIRSRARFFKKEYEKAWEDVNKTQELGYQVDPKFLKDLREASGRAHGLKAH